MWLVVSNRMLRKILSLDSNSDFYREHLSWTKKFVRDNIQTIEKNYDSRPNDNPWDCDCHVVHDNNKTFDPIDFELLRRNYIKPITNFCKRNNYKGCSVSNLWYNYYKKNQYQEPHIHDEHGVGYTVVHYLLFDKRYHSQTQFTDPGIVSPKVRAGDVLFFPASYEHYVPENDSDVPRLTVAFTINPYG